MSTAGEALELPWREGSSCDSSGNRSVWGCFRFVCSVCHNMLSMYCISGRMSVSTPLVRYLCFLLPQASHPDTQGTHNSVIMTLNRNISTSGQHSHVQATSFWHKLNLIVSYRHSTKAKRPCASLRDAYVDEWGPSLNETLCKTVKIYLFEN